MTESKLLVEDRAIVAPGQVLAEGMEYFPGPGTYRFEERILASQIGMVHGDGKVLKATPLAGRYSPERNDVIIGKVVDILMSGWRIDMDGAYQAVLPLQDASSDYIQKGADLTEYFDLDDYVSCKVTQVTSQKLIDVTMKGHGLRKLVGGHFIRVNPAKVPRLIGRKGSMVSMIKHATGCQIVVGQNGIVWVHGEPEKEVIAISVINRIESEAHKKGLTDQIKEFLEKETGTKIDLDAIQKEQERQRTDMPERRERPRGRPPRRGPSRGPPRRGPSRRPSKGPSRGPKGSKRFKPRQESFKKDR